MYGRAMRALIKVFENAVKKDKVEQTTIKSEVSES